MRRVTRLATAAILCAALATSTQAQDVETAIFAGGAFAFLDDDLGHVVGVLASETGYIGGDVPEPTFEAVSAQTTGHHMAVRVRFDPARISYRNLLIAYWLMIDPTDGDGQFCETGDSYRPAIFVLDPGQRRVAQASRARVERLVGERIVVPVLPATTFWLAEERQQDYAGKNPLRFDFYERSCGRTAGLRAFWAGVPMLASQP